MDARERRILDVIVALGEGEVSTYGDIAEVAGYPKRARLVGRILATTALDVPWWRVVNAAGRLVPGHEREQAQLLRAEGVVVRAGRVRAAPLGRFSRPPRPAPPPRPRRSTTA
jgi:methylated-DNA-protein-cysteine methyltransferase-like protein